MAHQHGAVPGQRCDAAADITPVLLRTAGAELGLPVTTQVEGNRMAVAGQMGSHVHPCRGVVSASVDEQHALAVTAEVNA